MNQALREILFVSCPHCSKKDFQVRAMADEGLATLKCVACSRDYLLLDSEDYWFDAIQTTYPRLRNCSCGSSAFGVCLEFHFRADGDIESIDVRMICSGCQKERMLMNIDIDYPGAEQLIAEPLRYCKNPKVIYDVKLINLYASRNDIANIARFLATACHCAFTGWLWVKDGWVRRDLTADETEKVLLQEADQLRPESYLRIYAMPKLVEIPIAEVCDSRKEDAFWRKREIIKIPSPAHVEIGGVKALWHRIDYANEFIEGQNIIRKSSEFIDMTNRLLNFLKAQFVNWRGPLCFDNPSENIRIFGDQFKKKCNRHQQ